MTNDGLLNARGLRRFHSKRRLAFLATLTVFACCWFWLYFDSTYQRRKAERFIADLKSFPFATAGFREVRDLSSRNGGAGLQQFPPRWPVPGAPSRESWGTMNIQLGDLNLPLVQTGPLCTAQDCTFDIWIKARLARLPLPGWAAEALYATLPYLGIRAWVIYARFEVRGGKLDRSRTTVGELRHGTSGPYEGLIPFGYEVVSTADFDPVDRSYDYDVGFPHITGPPSNVLSARIAQRLDAPMQRAFDIDLRCLTAAFHSCSGFGELVPSAWSDYLVQKAESEKAYREQDRLRRQ